MIKTPAAGSKRGDVWQDKDVTDVSQIFISYKPSKICSLQFQLVDESENLFLSPLHGSDDGASFSVVNIDYIENEFLIGLAGEYDEAGVLFSLSFETNRKMYGPFGAREQKEKDGVSFDIQIGDGDRDQTFCGFHGTACEIDGLTSIGLYFKPRARLSAPKVIYGIRGGYPACNR